MLKKDPSILYMLSNAISGSMYIGGDMHMMLHYEISMKKTS